MKQLLRSRDTDGLNDLIRTLFITMATNCKHNPETRRGIPETWVVSLKEAKEGLLHVPGQIDLIRTRIPTQ